MTVSLDQTASPLVPTNGSFAPIRLSTNDLPEPDRVAVWREVIGRNVVRLDLEPVSDRPLRSEVSVHALPGLVMMRGDISDFCVARTRALLADGNNDFRLEIRCTGHERLAQRGREVALGGGDATLAYCAETLNARQSTGQFLGLHIPYADLAALVPNVEDAIVRPIPRGTQALRLLTGYLGVLQHQEELATPELRRSVVSHIHDLVALIVGAGRDAAMLAEGRGARAARLHALKRDIVENLGRGALTMSDIVARHRLQPRYIQRLFEEDGTTFSEFVLTQRLSRAYRMLTDVHRHDWTVAAIATACGFNDQSYFNRRFKRFYGASPSGVRDMGRRQS